MRFLPLLFLLVTALPAQPRLVTIRDCLDAARMHKQELLAAEYDVQIVRSRAAGEKGSLGPRMTLGYDLDYHVIIPTQVIPTGEFLPVPSDEQRPVRFGTPWQQAAGMTVYQPLLDYLNRSRIAERDLEVRLREVDLQAREETLAGDILRSSSRLRTLAAAITRSTIDTAGTWTIIQRVRARVEEGLEIRSELNEARVNHNRLRAAFLDLLAEERQEKIRLAWLSGIPVSEMEEAVFDFRPLDGDSLERLAGRFTPDSSPAFQSYDWQEKWLGQQIQTTRRKRMPVLGLQGFLGANQFANAFAPFQANTWYGSSYMGIHLSFPLLPGEDLKNGIRQLQLAQDQVRSTREEARDRQAKDDHIASDELRRLREQEAIIRSNLELLDENVQLIGERYVRGQVTAQRLMETEIEWQREHAVLLELESNRTLRLLDKILASGQLSEFLGAL